MQNFHAAGDLLLERLGAASHSHPEEFAQIMADLLDAGVDLVSRPGTLAYSPSRGAAGRMILDPEHSIGALRHEYEHFLDHRAAGFPGFRPFMENPAEFARLEVRGYTREIDTAIETENGDLVPAITRLMLARVRELLGDESDAHGS